MQICFIVDNSLTMLQKTSNSQLCFFDHIKNCLEKIVKSIDKLISMNLNLNFYLKEQLQKVRIYLFATSSTEPLASFENNCEKHIVNQIKSMQCTIPTFPAQVIESALYHLGNFRCLEESQTLLGYREGKISDPTLIFYITGNSNCRHISKINEKVLQKKMHLRAQYKFITIKYCLAGPCEANLNNLEKFKAFAENQRESLMMNEVMKKINGVLTHIYSSATLVKYIQNTIIKHTPTLSMTISHKVYKNFDMQIVKLRLQTSQNEKLAHQYLKSLQQPSVFIKDSYSARFDFFIQTKPSADQIKIPLPWNVASKNINQFIMIDKLEPLNYYIDFTKQISTQLQSSMKFLFSVYTITPNEKLKEFLKYFKIKKKFPIFYEQQRKQFLVGFLQIPSQSEQNSQILQLYFSFCNFLNLNWLIKRCKELSPVIAPYFQNYLSTLPVFYHKFLQACIVQLAEKFPYLSPLLNEAYDNINLKPIGRTNFNFYEKKCQQLARLIEDKNINFKLHQLDKSQCCGFHSDYLQNYQEYKSNQYLNRFTNTESNNLVSNYFNNTIKKLVDFKHPFGLKCYIYFQQIKSESMQKQLEKYKDMRKNLNDMDQLVGGFLGNPFKKINKSLKIHDDAQSVWMGPEEIDQMKQFLNNEFQILNKMPEAMDKKNMIEDAMSMDCLYDKIAGLEQIMINLIKDPLNSKKNSKIEPAQNQTLADENILVKQKAQTGIQSQIKESLDDPIPEQPKRQSNSFKVDSKQGSQCLYEKEQYLWQDDQLKNQIISEVIQQANNKFMMIKPTQSKIPINLIYNQLYRNNKTIIEEVIGKKIQNQSKINN